MKELGLTVTRLSKPNGGKVQVTEKSGKGDRWVGQKRLGDLSRVALTKSVLMNDARVRVGMSNEGNHSLTWQGKKRDRIIAKRDDTAV